ncbi:caspase recruitment domain-containing protein 14 [Bombina bombina]|uniref:caspase recruitment domain-containing protein 14 n=1 Tax=Bombina bombina TaxID=8345 RepID=UPI00235A9C12|nr:caspase recruitment domain-containing protein 14 [Bombina bombina]
MAMSWQADEELQDLDEEQLWEMIEKHRCKVVQKLFPERLTPYLRQAKVLDEWDEEEILQCTKFTNRTMRMGRLLDLLRTRGKNGAIAFLGSLFLMYPKIYTLITGKEATLDPDSFSKLIDRSQLSVFLMNALASLQEELTQEKQLKICLAHHLRKMREKLERLEEEGESMRSAEQENQRLRKEIAEQSQIMSKLKDEQYELSMRYSHALQEKDTIQSRNNSLQEKYYAVIEELNRVRIDLQAAQGWTTRAQCEEELQMLRKENRNLRDSIEQNGQSKLETLDLNVQSTQELLAQLSSAREQIKEAETLEKLWQEEKRNMLQESEILRKKTDAFHSQVSELQSERDQAYRARDVVQAEISQVLAKKDSLRQQIIDLTDTNSNLWQQIRSLEIQLQTHEIRGDCQDPSRQRQIDLHAKHNRLVRMHALLPLDDGDKGYRRTFDPLNSLSKESTSDLNESFGSSASLQDDYLTSEFYSCSNELPDLIQGEKGEEIDSVDEEGLHMLSHMAVCDPNNLLSCPETPVPKRRHARRMLSRVTTIAFQGENLLKQICIIGGNRTGIFIHQVIPGSAADEMSLMPGCQILEVDFDFMNPIYKVPLTGMPFEDAHCTLNRVNGFCCLSVRGNMEEYRKLLNDIESGSCSSGDSFYVRVNQSMEGRIGGGLQVTCGEILHITDTMFKNRSQWFAYRVNAYTMKHGESGIIPNYRQAQQQLITSIQHMTWQNVAPRRPKKEVHIVSTDRCSSHLLWTSLDCDVCQCEGPLIGSALGKSCLTLMPYTLVTHLKIMTKRPVLLVPSLLGRILSEKICTNKDFMKCDIECLTEPEYAARYQRGEIIGEKDAEGIRRCFTRQNVEAVAQQNAHCLLELGLSCVSALIRVGLYPIILHIPLTDKSTKKLKKPLQWWRNCEGLLLECAQREEPELDALPCLYRTLDPDSWSDTDSLVCSVRDAITDEQKRIIWLEKNPC